MTQFISDAMKGLDAWLEAPYQQAERDECPDCGEHAVTSDKNGAECSECDWSTEPDWDSIAEDRAEARARDLEDGW